MDTVVLIRGKSKGCLTAFIERQTRFYVAIKIENRSVSEMYRAIGQLYERYPEHTFKIYMMYLGKEFAYYSKYHFIVTLKPLQNHFASLSINHEND